MSSATSQNWERRIEAREAAVLEVHLRDDQVKVRATSRNISRHGASVTTSSRFFLVGSLVDIIFVRRTGKVIHLHRHTAIVMHRFHGGIGLRFCAV